MTDSPTTMVNVMTSIIVLTFREEPKSVSFPLTDSSSSSENARTLSGLMSQCRIPFHSGTPAPSQR